MSDGWTFTGEAAATTGCVTLIEGSTFCRSTDAGNIHPDSAEGLFLLDTRVLSRWQLTVEGHPVEQLAATQGDPNEATFVGRNLLEGGGNLLVTRRRTVSRGMHEVISITSYAPRALEAVVELFVDVDFADLFEVKEGRARTPRPRHVERDKRGLRISNVRGELERTVEIAFSEQPVWSKDRALWILRLEPRETWTCTATLGVRVAGSLISTNGSSAGIGQLSDWRQAVPSLVTDHHPLQVAVERGVEDLGSLRIFDPADPSRPVIAAGAPWFMTLFGRDALLTSYMALIVDPDLALGVLRTLARLQADRTDPTTDSAPGKILHEVRFAETMSTRLGEGQIYYGSVDSSPLFVMLLGELRRWGLAIDEVDALLPAADRALAWMDDAADAHGFLQYERSSPTGLRNQGWKDSWDGVNFQDGRLAEPPIALTEVQGYAYAAYVARAHFAAEAGDFETEQRYRTKAAALKDAFNERFWLEDRGWYAAGLDADNRPIDALASNMGHCLWTGIIDPARAQAVADHLLSPEMFSGWGIRTLATSAGRYDPLAYHNGSVWPHENALIAAGLARYGFIGHAHRVIVAMLDAAAALDGRLPELFSGLSREEVPVPVAYPASSSPQAWAAAAPLLFLRTLLRFDPWVPFGKLWCAPSLPEQIQTLSLARIPLAGARITVRATVDGARTDGLPSDVQLISEPRDPLISTTVPGGDR